jgi:hypothetical protein
VVISAANNGDPIELLLFYFKYDLILALNASSVVCVWAHSSDPTTIQHGSPSHPCLSHASAAWLTSLRLRSFQNPSRAQLCPGGRSPLPIPPPSTQRFHPIAVDGPGPPCLPTAFDAHALSLAGIRLGIYLARRPNRDSVPMHSPKVSGFCIHRPSDSPCTRR